MGRSLSDNLKNDLKAVEELDRAEYGAPEDADLSIPTTQASAARVVQMINLFPGTRRPLADGNEAKFLEDIAAHIAAAAFSHAAEHLQIAITSCESPIERVLLSAVWLQAVRQIDLPEGKPALYWEEGGHSLGTPFGEDSVTIEPQPKIGDFRPDFRITCVRRTWGEKDGKAVKLLIRRAVLVECDGHDFHERTKEQAARDKSRDRDLQAMGFPVFRFTGSEIWNKPVQCAKQIIDFVSDISSAKPSA